MQQFRDYLSIGLHIVPVETILHQWLRGDVKYYFADFVRNGGAPPPFTDKIFGKEGVTDLGGTPLPPFTDKISAKRGLRIWGVPPPLTDKIRKVVFDILPWSH